MRSLLAFTHPALSSRSSSTAVAAAAAGGGDGDDDGEDEEEDEEEEFEGGKAMPRGGTTRGSSAATPATTTTSYSSPSSRFAAPAGPPPTFPTMRGLKGALARRGLLFCEVCLKGRKVFACEQLVYTRRSLARHKAAGDAAGPLAESGFSGHPRCDFCLQRFYVETELFVHMQTRHEHCFLCRRVRPPSTSTSATTTTSTRTSLGRTTGALTRSASRRSSSSLPPIRSCGPTPSKSMEGT